MKFSAAVLSVSVLTTLSGAAHSQELNRPNELAVIALSAVHCGMIIDSIPPNIFNALGITNSEEEKVAYYEFGQIVALLSGTVAKTFLVDPSPLKNEVMCSAVKDRATKLNLKYEQR